jgi:hypothetical protein
LTRGFDSDGHIQLHKSPTLQNLYRAMDVFLENDESIKKEVFFSTAALLNLEVDLIFFETTSTYLERVWKLTR